jgi:RNA polymerase primary sigma factor
MVAVLRDELTLFQPALGRTRAMSRDEECALLRRAQGGDAKARDAMVENALPLVLSLVRRHRRTGVSRDDLIQEGVLGLLQAISRFDPSKGAPFAAYATWWVRAYVTRYTRTQMGAVRGGAERGHAADISLDDEDSHLAPQSDAPSAEEEVVRAESARQVAAALDSAHKRIGDVGWDIIHRRTADDEPLTLEVIGRRWGISRERVRQLEKRTHDFLRHYLEPLAD